MQLFYNRFAALLLFVILAAILVVRGVLPAMSRIDTDFPNYLTAAKIVAEGGPVDRLYDGQWFEQQAHRYGIGTQTAPRFMPFPPPTALLLIPLARLEPLNALRVMTAVSIACLIASCFLLARIVDLSVIDSAVFVLLSGYAVINSLRFGQPYVVVSAACILGYYAYLKGWPLLAGICFGLFVPIKYFPIVILLYFAFRREWKVALGGALTVLLIGVVSVGVLGWKIHAEFLSSVFANHLVGRLGTQDPFTASFQSFDSLFRRLFIYDAADNPQPFLSYPALQVFSVAAMKLLLLCAGLATLIRLARNNIATAAAPSIGILGILALLIAPATATYHFVLLWLPIGLLLRYFFDERRRLVGYFILATYAFIGFLPYGHAFRFEGRGGLTVLAYPRLFALLAMLAAAIYGIWMNADGKSKHTIVRRAGHLQP